MGKRNIQQKNVRGVGGAGGKIIPVKRKEGSKPGFNTRDRGKNQSTTS